MSGKRLYVIDATAFCYRAFYALRGLSTSFGQPTNAIYGFVAILNKIIKEKKPEYLAICFDVSRDTFRKKKFAEYKMQRPPMPDGLSSQIPFIKRIIAAYGIAMYEVKGFEADDVIASLARYAQKQGLETTIVSSDKDILQLVNEHTLVWSPYKDDGTLYDQKKVLERFGVTPSAIPDLIGLMGDAADNIPGVPGIGEKTAVELIKASGSLEKLLSRVEEIPQENLQKTIKEHLDSIRLSRELAVLDKDVEVDFSLEKLKIPQPDHKELFGIFKYLEFKRLLKELPVVQQEGVPHPARVLTSQDSGVTALLSGQDTLFVWGDTVDNLAFYANDTVFMVASPGPVTKGILADPTIKKIGHDLKKLRVGLARQQIPLEGLYFDTMIAAYLLNPAKATYSLADVVWDHAGQMLQDTAMDAASALSQMVKLVPAMEIQLREKELLELFRNIEMPLVTVLADMELDGIKLNTKAFKELSLELENRLIGLIEDIYSYSGCQFNINSPKQLREILFEKLKLPVVKKTKTGPSTDEEVLRALAPRHKLPALLLEYRQLTKLKNTYIDTLPDMQNFKTGRVHASFNQTGTETGRLSSSNPNLQNLPVKTDVGKKIRQAIIPYDDQSVIVSCDYSQIELRILAHICKDEALIEAFRQDKDIHRITAALIYGIEENEVTDTMREVAKRVNFGIVYGLTSYGLCRDLGISVDEAQRFIDAYFLRYPAVKAYIQEQIEKAEGQGFVTTILGRRRYLPEINNRNQAIRQFAQRQAVNAPIQGSASDLIKLAMVHIHEAIRRKALASRMMMQIHDELVFNMLKDEEEGFIDLVKDKMEHVLELLVPVRVSIKKGKNWLDMESV